MHTGLISEITRTEERVQEKLLHTAKEIVKSGLNRYSGLEQGEGSKIVSGESIRRICLKYRLRFLEIKYFRGNLPGEALSALAEIRTRYGLALDKLSIIAPAGMLNLGRREKDPVLLAALPDGRYLIICKWGAEFSRLRAISAYPFRNPMTMLVSGSLISVFITVLLTWMVPALVLTAKEFLFGSFITWFGCMAYGLYISFAHAVFPTSAIWNSKFLD